MRTKRWVLFAALSLCLIGMAALCLWHSFRYGGIWYAFTTDYGSPTRLERQAEIWQHNRPAGYWMVLEYSDFFSDRSLVSITVRGDCMELFTRLGEYYRATEVDASEGVRETVAALRPDKLISHMRDLADEMGYGGTLRVRCNKRYGYIEEVFVLRRTSILTWEREALHIRVLRFEPLIDLGAEQMPVQ